MAMAKNRGETGSDEKRSRRCELCEVAAAAVHCESDEARLCWGCDAQVHGANFLVSRHVRSLLCRRCFSPTPWRADGERLSPTLSICHGCSCCHERKPEEGENQVEAVEEREVITYNIPDDAVDVDDDDDCDSEEDEEEDSYGSSEEDDEDEEEDEGENQVVPWSSPAATPTITTTASSQSSSEREEGDLSSVINHAHNMFLKRMRELRDITVRGDAEDDDDEGEATSYLGDFRESKRAMTGRVLSLSGASDAQ